MVGFVLLVSRRARTLLRIKLREGKDAAVGICAAALGQMARKNANKEKILALLRERGEMGNEDIREELGISRRSVARYMDELEEENRVEQAGDIGRGVIYRPK